MVTSVYVASGGERWLLSAHTASRDDEVNEQKGQEDEGSHA